MYYLEDRGTKNKYNQIEQINLQDGGTVAMLYIFLAATSHW